MLRTDRAIIEVVSRDWKNIINVIKQRIVGTFQTYPHHFFTEHDIHSVLYSITNEELLLSGVLEEMTRDGHEISLVHHEYPTPFRCSMKGYGIEKKDKKPYKRGHYDLVILNPNFVRNNELQIVCGKNFEKFGSAMDKVKIEPLIWACEVIYFPGVRGLSKNALIIIKQDALKVKETIGHTVNGRPFCKLGSVLVFTSHTVNEVSNLRHKVARLGKDLDLEIVMATGQ